MFNIENKRGLVFNIQPYSIHDGPGIRTTVFIHGCPLKCLWCQNPESQILKPQLFLNAEKCTGCGQCISVCPQHAIEIVNGKSKTNHQLCQACGQCVGVCPHEVRELIGKEMSAGEVFQSVNSDNIFYQKSGGGITISGGDPLSQPDFTEAILRLCQSAGIHTALETSGYARWDVFRKLLAHTDMVLYDLKHMDPLKHKEYTGVSNDIILANFIHIIEEFPHITIAARLPIIPGYNDSPENLAAAATFIKQQAPQINVHLLPYHRLGETKYERMEQPEKIIKVDPPSDQTMQDLRILFERYGLKTFIGG